jgi:hypothetical protein
MFSLMPDGKSVKIRAVLAVTPRRRRNSFKLRRKVPIPIGVNGATRALGYLGGRKITSEQRMESVARTFS